MSSVTSVQVQLPSFAHSFSVSVPSDSTILDFKHELSRTCVGAPNASGQRVIYRGRVLADTEVVGQVWKTTDGPHTCHLAVHPSAWTAAPPSTTPPTTTLSWQSLPSATPSPTFRATAASVPPGSAVPLQAPSTPHATYSYIQYMHTNALRILARQSRLSWPEQIGDLEGARAFAKRGIELTGRGWPSYLNQDFPNNVPEQTTDEGVKYASTYIDNLPYLSLLTPDATPTPLQAQAIRVLSYTFPLLCVYPILQAQPSHPLQVHAIPPRPLAPLGVAVQGAFQIPIRPLILPLILLTIRTTLLLYFFQPARKPLFGLMVLIWVIWEVAGAVRRALGGQNGDANGGQNNRAEAVGNANAAPAEAGARARDRPAGNNNINNNDNVAQPAINSQDAVLNHLGQVNIASEARVVEPESNPDTNTPPLGLVHKVKTFFMLLFLTLHPAIWDRRRTALRAREGRLREDARMREARVLQRERERREREEIQRRGLDGSGEGEGGVLSEPMVEAPEPPPPVPRPFWVAEYVQRVRSGDWVDDM